ncbi:MAG: ABC transporter permease [Tannerellaceae bacterium]|jgi:ABC-2 type transport system permease protein|nr:ABC transporter permease [Tannerellaceae bacterium]
MNCYDIARREIRRFAGHPVYLFGILGAPLFCAFFFLTLMGDGLPAELPAAVVDMDDTPVSRNLVRQLDAFKETRFVMKTHSFTEARLEMQKRQIYGIYFIPEHFSADAITGKQPVLSFYINPSYLVPSTLLFQDMKTVSVLANASVGLQKEMAAGQTEAQSMAKLQPFVIDTHALGNPWFNYSIYLCNTILPGILQLMIFLLTVYSIAMEIKDGTAREWLRMGNYSLTRCLLGKLLPQTLIFTITGFALCAWMYGFLNFPLHKGWLPMLSAMFLLIIASQAGGVFMIGILPVPRLGLGLASLFGMLAFSVIGLSYPVSNMHPAIQSCANLFPLRHYFLIYVDQALYGRDWVYSWVQYVALAGFLSLPLLIGSHLKRALLYFKYIP